MHFKKTYLTLIMLAMLVFTACGVDDLFDNKENNGVQPSTTMVDKTTFYGLGESEGIVIADMHELPERAVKINGQWFLSVNSVTGINDHFYWNSSEEQMIVTNSQSISYYWPDSLNASVNGEGTVLEQAVITIQNNTLYVSLDLFKQYTQVVCQIFEEPDRIVIWTDWEQLSSYKVVAEAASVRTGANVTSDILVKEAKASEGFITGEETAGFVPVMTKEGYCGYIAAEEIEKAEDYSFEQPEGTADVYTHNLMAEDYFTIVWHNMTYAADGSLLSGELDGSEGVDVVIPTWYRVIDTEGNISSNANRSYVDKAHNMGMEVWGLVDDFAAGVPGIDVLSSTAARNNLADSLVSSALEYGLDGINVDFEYITNESAPHFIQFLRELSLKMKPYGLKLSVDNFVPDSYNSFYNLEAQEEVVDYIILMTYDEHYSPETGTGSVASIGFVENGIVGALEYIPNDRLVMGIPFYTRLWETHGDGTVTMQTLTMINAMYTVDYYGLTPEWDETAGQYYVNYADSEGLNCEMWLEEAESIGKKREVCDKYGLAGTACWCLGNEEDDVWEKLK
ncbi:MAG: glycosyl hydrolase family 18 protein [Lachnospiraceae bacterium]